MGGMRSCPGNFDHRACPMPDICVAEGDECPYVCPPLKHPHCGFVMANCAGPVDAMGCETPMNCIMWIGLRVRRAPHLKRLWQQIVDLGQSQTVEMEKV